MSSNIWSKMVLRCLAVAPFIACGAASIAAESDIVIADFEQGYGDWKIKGEAFNHPSTRISGPPLKGFNGKGLADSWDPDREVLTGSLTSPEFTIERRFIRFLMGGRGAPASNLRLFIDGKLEFSASGVGSRELRAMAFDVSSFIGRKARVVINDDGKWSVNRGC